MIQRWYLVCRTHSKHSNSRLRLNNNTARLHKYSLFMKTKTGFAVQIRQVLYRGWQETVQWCHHGNFPMRLSYFPNTYHICCQSLFSWLVKLAELLLSLLLALTLTLHFLSIVIVTNCSC